MRSSLLAGRSAQVMERSKALIAWPRFVPSPPIDGPSIDDKGIGSWSPCLPVPESRWGAGEVLLIWTVSFECSLEDKVCIP